MQSSPPLNEDDNHGFKRGLLKHKAAEGVSAPGYLTGAGKGIIATTAVPFTIAKFIETIRQGKIEGFEKGKNPKLARQYLPYLLSAGVLAGIGMNERDRRTLSRIRSDDSKNFDEVYGEQKYRGRANDALGAANLSSKIVNLVQGALGNTQEKRGSLEQYRVRRKLDRMATDKDAHNLALQSTMGAASYAGLRHLMSPKRSKSIIRGLGHGAMDALDAISIYDSFTAPAKDKKADTFATLSGTMGVAKAVRTKKLPDMIEAAAPGMLAILGRIYKKTMSREDNI